MKLFMEALNHPAVTFKKELKAVSWFIVLISILINAVFEPVLNHFCGAQSSTIDWLKMLIITGYGILSYITICIIFWVVSKCFGSKATLMSHINAWGITFFPNIICSFAVTITEVFFYVFWNSTIWGMLASIIFVGILLWKVILYIIYLREFAELKGWRFFGAFIIMNCVILALAALNGYVGLKTPIL
jgi:hypothetical protein